MRFNRIGFAFCASALTAAALWIMGCLYNFSPVRTKDVPYLDVLTESINNPLRLLLGWSAIIDTAATSQNIAPARSVFQRGIMECMEGDDAAANKHYQEAKTLLGR